MKRARNRLTIILGAGSSFDCCATAVSDVRMDWRPPLVHQLFDKRESFNGILHKYHKAEAASEEIRTKLRAGEDIEVLLRKRNEQTALTSKKQVRQVVLYIQELMGEIGKYYVGSGGNKFETLVNTLENSSLSEIMFLTLNYDLFLERALDKVVDLKFRGIGSYINGRYPIVKLHGSVNWGREVLNQFSRRDTATETLDSVSEELKLSEEYEVLDGHHDEQRFKGNKLFYPAVSIPIEGKTEFNCPSGHVDFAKEFLKTCSDYLLIGFSAKDDHALEILKDSGSLSSVSIVNGSRQDGQDALERIKPHNPAFSPSRWAEAIFDGGFEPYVGTSELEKFVSARVPVE